MSYPYQTLRSVQPFHQLDFGTADPGTGGFWKISEYQNSHNIPIYNEMGLKSLHSRTFIYMILVGKITPQLGQASFSRSAWALASASSAAARSALWAFSSSVAARSAAAPRFCRSVRAQTNRRQRSRLHYDRLPRCQASRKRTIREGRT